MVDDPGGTPATQKVTIANLAIAIAPAWSSWSGTVVGWSSTTIATKYYQQIGKTVHFIIEYNGTSNSTSTTFTLPVAASTNVAAFGSQLGLTYNNGAVISPSGRWEINTASTQLITCLMDQVGTGWTASGTKIVRLQGFYETT